MIHGDYFIQKAKNIHDVKKKKKKKKKICCKKTFFFFFFFFFFYKIIECNIQSVASTDHRGCSVLFKFAEIERGPGYWKFNKSHLKYPISVNQMNTVTDNHTAGLDSKSDDGLDSKSDNQLE